MDSQQKDGQGIWRPRIRLQKLGCCTGLELLVKFGVLQLFDGSSAARRKRDPIKVRKYEEE